jgi:E3 ubiquitin-protein ligase HUWE1
MNISLPIKPTHHDMQAIDPGYYRNLKMILEYNLEDIGLDLTFSTEEHSFGRSQTIDLIPNGRNIPVTEENKEDYVKLVCQHRMTSSIQGQIKAYLDGFYELIKPELISIFTAKELELLISGLPDIDIHDLQANTEYQSYKPSDPQIIWFWNIMFSLTKSEKAAFLQFVTGSSKVPLEGFSQLQGMRGTQKFTIHRASGSNAALVSAHTCFNAMDLPVYNSEEEMREKLLYAINEGAEGFLFA